MRSNASTRAWLPSLSRSAPPPLAHPDPAMAERVWRASQALTDLRPMTDLFPEYGDPPETYVDASLNTEAACHDFPDLPEVFGPGVHPRACHFSVASYLGNYHAVAARHEDRATHVAWAKAYLHLALLEAQNFMVGPEHSSPGGGYRDTFAATWQNPLRAVDLAVLASQLRALGALDGWTEAHVAAVLAGIAEAWRAAWWETGVHPSDDVTLAIAVPPRVAATSPRGEDVACRVPWAIAWDADGRNSPAEETAWMGAGAMLAARILQAELPEVGPVGDAGRHYVDFALSYDRADPLHGGEVRTLSRGGPTGSYGERRYWLKNHAADAPAIPYVAATWHFIGTALMASPRGDQRPWPELVPDDAHWLFLRAATEANLAAPDGTSLVDWSDGGGIGYALDSFPLWWTECGQPGDGRAYTLLDPGASSESSTGDAGDDVPGAVRGEAGSRPMFLSEIGHPAGLDLLSAGWVVRRLAADRGDVETYRLWTSRMMRILDEYTRYPPDPTWSRCKFAPYVSANPAYHYARFLSAYSVTELGLSGFEVKPWSW